MISQIYDYLGLFWLKKNHYYIICSHFDEKYHRRLRIHDARSLLLELSSMFPI